MSAATSRVAEGGARVRPLGVWSLLALGINGIVGVGIFFTPSLLAELVPGTRGVWVYALTLLALLPVAATYARLGARFDRDGGPYVWARAAFGARAGFVVGFAAYASAVFSTSAVLAGIGEYTGPWLGFSGDQRHFSLGVALLFAAVVWAGLEPSAKLWSGLTLLKLLPLVGLLLVFALAPAPTLRQETSLAAPSWSRAMLLVVFAMQGFEIVPVPGAHARSPERTIPIATLGSLVGCALLYMCLQWACARTLPNLATTSAPLVAAAGVLGGERLAALLRAGTNVSAVGIGFGMMAMTPRYLSALAGAAGLGELEHEAPQQVPRRALIVTLLLVGTLVSSAALSRLFVLSSVAVLFQYSVSVLALAKLALGREHGVSRRDGLFAPLALVALGLLARAVERAELVVMSGILLVGVLLGFASARLRK